MKKFLLVPVMFLFVVSAQSQIQTSWRSPSNAKNQAGIGTLVWNNPEGVFTQGSSSAYTTPGQTGITNYVSTANYGFTLPAPCPSCVVGGIEARIRRRAEYQPNVAMLNGWAKLIKSNGGYNFSVSTANPPTVMNKALIVVIGIENGPHTTTPTGPPTPNNDSRDVTAVTYGGVAMTQACEVAFSNLGSGTAFWARNEIWFLNDAGIEQAQANGSNKIIITNGNKVHEYVEFVSAAAYQNVDQLAPIFDSRIDTVVGNVNPFNLGHPTPMRPGSVAITSVVCGNPGSYTFDLLGASGVLGATFSEGTDQNGLNDYTYGSSTPTMMTGQAFIPDPIIGNANVFPRYRFSGYENGVVPNRQVISMVCLQRARDFDHQVRIIKNGVVTGTNMANPFTYPKAYDYQTYGGPSSAWGTSWTLADVQSSDFGLAISSQVQNRQVEIDHIQLRLTLFSTLPVELVDFNGERIEREIKLTWTTSSELNNDYFELHRSVDAVDYQMISVTDGAGNSNNLIEYIYDDFSAPQDKVSYYKIRQVDFDGNYKWYGPISVDPGDREGSLSLYPNPAVTTIAIGNLSSLEDFMIFDINGNVVKSGRMTNNVIDIDNLKVGTYFVSIGDNAQKIKFIKL